MATSILTSIDSKKWLRSKINWTKCIQSESFWNHLNFYFDIISFSVFTQHITAISISYWHMILPIVTIRKRLLGTNPNSRMSYSKMWVFLTDWGYIYTRQYYLQRKIMYSETHQVIVFRVEPRVKEQTKVSKPEGRVLWNRENWCVHHCFYPTISIVV